MQYHVNLTEKWGTDLITTRGSQEHDHSQLQQCLSYLVGDLRPPLPPRNQSLSLCLSLLVSVSLWICRTWRTESVGPAQATFQAHWVPGNQDPHISLHKPICINFKVKLLLYL